MATRYTNLADKQRKTRRRTPDRKPIPGREKEMIQNHAGGFSFATSEMQRLLRFLIVGADTNTYYQDQKTLVKENAKNVQKCIEADPRAVVDLVVDVSVNGRALRQDAGLFVLAMVAAYGVDIPQPGSDEERADYERAADARSYALSVLGKVARTPTALYTFANYIGDMRGWGRGLRRAFGRWYTEKPLNKLAMQAWKYKQRGGFSHRDVLRLAHPITDDLGRNKIFEYMTHPDESPLTKGLPKYKNGRVKGFASEVKEMGYSGDGGILRTNALNQIAAAEEVLHMGKGDDKRVAKLICDYRLTHEAVPSELKKSPLVWEALLEDMPLQAMVSNLGRLASVGLLKPMSEGQKKVVAELSNSEAIKRSRMHPMRFLIAAKQFGSGKGRSGMTWASNARVMDALDDAFYGSFGNVVPTGKNLLVAIDDSGSMQGGWGSPVMGIPNFSAAEAACAMGLVLYKTEPNCHMIGYATQYTEWKNLSKNIRIDRLKKLVGGGGGTYTALPLHYVLDMGLDVDGIVSFTDNETWAGGYWGYGLGRSGRSGKVAELLPQYSRKVGHSVKFINCATTATSCTDVDPSNKDMFEVAGFDAKVPTLIGEFLAGNV